MDRKLTTIVAMDVVGYSRSMERDEVGTLAALNSLRADIVDPAVSDHDGRTVKLMGDGALLEFGSVVGALQCVVDIQNGVAARNKSLSADAQIWFRIGVHLGDVIVEDDDIHGDGVNVAARLESLAEPGGICVSQQVHDQIGTKIDVGLTSMGEQHVKNIQRPITAYRVDLASKPVSTPPVSKIVFGRPLGRVAAVGVAVVALLASAIGWWLSRAPAFEPAEVAKMAYPLPEQPSLAVVPFRNLTGDPAQDTFVDGITDSIIGALTRVPDILIIDRGSSFAFKSETAQIKNIAEKFAVRYVLQGSVQRSRDKVRIQTQLADALSGRVVWAEDYDRQAGDVFDLQDDITHEILTELEVNLTQGEQARIRRRQTDNIDAFIAFLQGVEHFHTFSADQQVKAEKLFEKALELDPNFASAHAFLGYVHIKQARNSWVEDLEQARRDGEAHVSKALALDPENIDALSFKGQILMDAGEWEEAIQAFREAARLAPNYVDNLAALSIFLAITEGDPQEVKTIVKRVMRLSPNYPAFLLSALAWAHYFSGELDEAIELNETRRKLSPNSELPLVFLVIMNTKAGRTDEAHEALRALRELQPSYSVVHFERLGKKWFRPETFADLVEQLKKAGVPDGRDES